MPRMLMLAILAVCGQPLSLLHAAAPCATPPPPDPGKSFLQNFLTPCYAVPMSTQPGSAHFAEDLNATYSSIYYRVNSRYDLILVGEFPQARYMSVVPYDDHFAVVDWLYDAQMAPLPGFQNIFQPGVQFQEDQLYAVTFSLGGVQPPPQNVLPGCNADTLNLSANWLDATKRHPGMSWNGVPGMAPGAPPHDDAGPNKAGNIVVRTYLKGADQ